MSKRINLPQTQPEAVKAMMGLVNYVSTSKLTPIQKELIKIRASQLNGCSYCIDMHTKDARKYGETEQRLYLLSAWKETDLFSDEEQVILAMTEEITLIRKKGLTEETYEKAISLFDETKVTEIIMSIVTINAWNRIGVSTHMKPILVK